VVNFAFRGITRVHPALFQLPLTTLDLSFNQVCSSSCLALLLLAYGACDLSVWCVACGLCAGRVSARSPRCCSRACSGLMHDSAVPSIESRLSLTRILMCDFTCS
jgi:hypothetical protein